MMQQWEGNVNMLLSVLNEDSVALETSCVFGVYTETPFVHSCDAGSSGLC